MLPWLFEEFVRDLFIEAALNEVATPGSHALLHWTQVQKLEFELALPRYLAQVGRGDMP